MIDSSFDENRLNRRKDLLSTVYLGCVERIVKAFFLLNTGGLVAVLAYMYPNETIYNKWLLNMALIIFFLGIILSFTLVIADYLCVDNDLKLFKTRRNDFENKNISISEVFSHQPSRGYLKFLGVIAAVFFLIGSIMAFIGFWIK